MSKAVIWLCATFLVGHCSVVRFEPGKKYEYKYESKTSLVGVDDFHLSARVSMIHFGENGIKQEIQLLVEDFDYWSDANRTIGREYSNTPDLSGWFSFTITSEGEITETYYNEAEDPNVVAIKKGIISLLSGKYRQEGTDTETTGEMRYDTLEYGHEGEHNASYRVLTSPTGKMYLKNRTKHHNLPEHSDSSFVKSVTIDSLNRTINSVRSKEHVEVSHKAKKGYSPEKGMRTVKSVNEFENVSLPSMRVESAGKMKILRVFNTNISPQKPNNVSLHAIQHMNLDKRNMDNGQNITSLKKLIEESLACIVDLPTKESKDFMTNSSQIYLDCYRNMVKALLELPDYEVTNIVHDIFEGKKGMMKGILHQNIIMNGLFTMETELAQDLIVKYIFNNHKVNKKLFHQSVLRIGSIQAPPSEEVLKLFESFIGEDVETVYQRYGSETASCLLLSMGALSNRWTNHNQGSVLARKFTKKIKDILGLHDPYKYRMRRSIMTEAETLESDWRKVVYLETLGNSRHLDAFEYILSHANSTASSWVKRAAIHALRDYNYVEAADAILQAVGDNEYSEVSHEAWLAYQIHPAADQSRVKRYSGEGFHSGTPQSAHERSRRGILDTEHKWRLEAPSVDFRKYLGSRELGAAFGVVMINFFDLKISPQSGHFKVEIHDEAYARALLGFLGMNFDFFSARVCFKGGAKYNLNLLQEYDPRLNTETITLLAEGIKDIANTIKTTIDLITQIINGDISLKLIVDDFLRVFKELPNMVRELREAAIQAVESFGTMLQDNIPPFLQPMKALIDYVSNLMTDIKVDVMDFYYMLVQSVKVEIPRATDMIIKSVKTVVNEISNTNLFKNPKKSVARIGGGVLGLTISVSELLTVKDKLTNASLLTGQKPYWMDFKTIFEKIKDMTESAFESFWENANEWINEVTSVEDPIKELTGGKMSQALIRETIINSVTDIIEKLFAPFEKLLDIGDGFIQKLFQIFNLVENLKEGVIKVKKGYREARALIDKVFGPKFDSKFPKRIRESDSCARSGYFPSRVDPYEFDGVDLVAEAGSEIVAPLSGTIERTDRIGQARLTRITELPEGQEILIDNVELDDNIYNPNDGFNIERNVFAGERIGAVRPSRCTNHIHVVLRTMEGVADPSRFLAPRPPEVPEWRQYCNDKRVVIKGDTTMAEPLVHGVEVQNKSESLNDDGERPIEVDESKEFPKSETMMTKAVEQEPSMKKGSFLENAGDLIEILVKRTKAFLDTLSIRRIRLGPAVEFLYTLGLTESVDKIATILGEIKNLMDETPCVAPSQMTDDVLQTQLVNRGLSVKGDRQKMIETLTNPDTRCSYIAMAMRKYLNMHCFYGPECLEMECCVSLEVLNIFQKTYRAFFRVDMKGSLLYVLLGFDNWRKEISLAVDSYIKDEQDTIDTGLKFDFIEARLICKYAIEATSTDLILSYGCGMCRNMEVVDCINFVNIVENAVFKFPTISESGVIVYGDVDFEQYFDRERISQEFEEAGEELLDEMRLSLADEIVAIFGIPKEILKDNPKCKIYTDMEVSELLTEIQDRGIVFDGTAEDMIEKLYTADTTCTLKSNQSLQFPIISDEKIRNIMTYTVTKHCMRIDACLDVYIPLIEVTKTFTASIELDPCNFKLHLEFENYSKSKWLIDYPWGREEKLVLSKDLYLRYILDKNEDEFIVTAALKAKVTDSIDFDSTFVDSLHIPIPLCNGDFRLPGAGDLTSFAESVGGKLSEEAFNVFTELTGIQEILQDNERCILPMDPKNCTADPLDFVHESLQNVLKCKMLDNCWGISCCLDFGFKIPFSNKQMNVSIPFLFQYNPCLYFVKLQIGKNYERTRWLVEYEWGKRNTLRIGKGSAPPIVISYSIDKDETSFIMDANLNICLPLRDGKYCIPDNQGFHLIRNDPVNLCLLGNADSQGDDFFSLTEWLQVRGREIGDTVGEAGRDYILETFNLKGIVQIDSCNASLPPYSPRTNGWNIECGLSHIPSLILPNYYACHVSSDCKSVSCCVHVPQIDLAFALSIQLDLCANRVISNMETMTGVIDNALSDYKWGQNRTVSAAKALEFIYNIRKSTKNSYVVNAYFNACFERSGTCIVNSHLVNELEVPKVFCRPTDLVEEYLANVSYECSMDADLQGITCAIEDLDMNVDVMNNEVYFRIEPCLDKFFLQCGEAHWDGLISSLELGSENSQEITDGLSLIYSLDESPQSFYIDIKQESCIDNNGTLSCDSTTILSMFPLYRMNCSSTRKRKRDVEDIETKNIQDALKEFHKRDYSSEEINSYLRDMKLQEELLREEEFRWTPVGDSDFETKTSSVLKSMGFNNPMTMMHANQNTKWNFDIETKGGEAILNILNKTSTAIGKSSQLYVAGEGLTELGVKLLGKELAEMTIGDLEVFLEMNRVDPEVIHELITDLVDLAETLYEETIDAITSGELGNAFDAFEMSLRGSFNYPLHHGNLLPDLPPLIVPLGPVIIEFEYGASYFLGINIGIGVRIMSMVADASITPYAGISVYGRASFGFILYAEIELRGYILDVRFPTLAELDFSRFPIKVGLKMDLVLVPFRMTLVGKVTLKIRIPFCCSFRKTLFQATLWVYVSKPISSNVIDNTRREKDSSPPKFIPVVPELDSNGKYQTTDLLVKHCNVRQIPGLDYTEPAFEIQVAAEDDLSQLRFFLDVGTYPGGINTLNEFQLRGAFTKLSMELIHTGVPTYFTMHAQNSQGERASVSCSLKAYDVTIPTGRATAEFLTSSNPGVLRAVITAHDETELIEIKAAIGYGKGIHGDQVVNWHDVEIIEVSDDELRGADPSNNMSYFAGGKEGRLIGGVLYSRLNVYRVTECAAWCRSFSKHSCLSFNYDFGESGTCQISKAVEGHDHIIVKHGLFMHYERLGTGHFVELERDKLDLEHNALYFANLYMNNSLGYSNTISSKGILVDLHPPRPGLINNKQAEKLEKKDCLTLIPVDRKDLERYCVGTEHDISNHRIVIDGPNSATVFNGMHELFDEKFTRTNTYISANWDGIHDNETSIRVYTWAVGTKPCEDQIHPHHDPHAHLLSELQWNHKGQIYPLPPPYTILPDGKYYITVKALNTVEYGGPLAITVCHTTPYVIDTSPPYIHGIYDIRYDENSFFLYADIDIGDLHSGISEFDLCLGKSSHDCKVLPWYRFNYVDTSRISHRFKLPDGIPVWLRIRAVNNVQLTTVGVSDQALLVDDSAPIAGFVYDGQTYKIDQIYSKESNEICVNWDGFFDPESGISAYLVGIGSQSGKIDLTGLREISYKDHFVCLAVPVENELIHGMTYFATVYAINGGIVRRNVSAVSNGVTVDTTPPTFGEVIDGVYESFKDLKYSSSETTVSAQWRGILDEESGVTGYSVRVETKRFDETYILQDWINLEPKENHVVWKNFQLKHKDFIKSELKAENGATNSVTLDTDGFMVDLTAPVLKYIHDGTDSAKDIQFQSHINGLSVNFDVTDSESGMKTLSLQIQEQYNGYTKKIWPVDRQWYLHQDPSVQSFSVESIALLPSARYTFLLAAENNAGLSSIHETDGVTLDTTPPLIRWLHVGVFYGEKQELHDNYVYQADDNGIKISFLAIDAQSGVSEVFVKVGTSIGTDDIAPSKSYRGIDKDIYLDELELTVTDRTTMRPVYYVTLQVQNGAGELSDETVSAPIVVVPEDVPGIVVDGIIESDDIFTEDLDYTFDDTTMKVSFDGFKSNLFDIKSFIWAVGTVPGSEDILPFTDKGVTYEERLDDNGSIYSGKVHLPVSLKLGNLYFVTLRGIRYNGLALQSITDGILIDKTPPVVKIERVLNHDVKQNGDLVYYSKESQNVFASWVYEDPEIISSEIMDNINIVAAHIGSFPGASDVMDTEIYLASGMRTGELTDANILENGLPNFLTVTVENKGGLRTTVVAPAVTLDNTRPEPGDVACSQFSQPKNPIHCEWSGYYDSQSSITFYKFFFGSKAGYDDILDAVLLNSTTKKYLVTAHDYAKHGDVYYATVVALNSIDTEVASFSNPIYIDTTPPTPGTIVVVAQEQVTLDGSTIEIEGSCNINQDCFPDVICQTSFTSISVKWSPFEDQESGIECYYIALGTTSSGTDLLGFTQMTVDSTKRSYTVTGLNLKGIRQVFAKIKAVNGAGLSSISSSNGVYISYIKQDLDPVSPIAIWDSGENDIGDIDNHQDASILRAKWDVSGEPCPVYTYEWKIMRLDGVVIQNFTTIHESTEAFNDRLQLNNGETYFSLLRVTNIDGFSYILRSDGVTIRTDSLSSGIVHDGGVTGYDLNVLPSKSIVTCNWKGFGVSSVVDHEEVITGNSGVTQNNPDYQTVAYYEVALGTDRRFPETRTNIVPFTNVGASTLHTFTDLDLIPGTSKYYFTVRAYSVAGSTAQAMSNGFYVSLHGGVSAGFAQIPSYSPSLTTLEIPWQGFTSQEGMMLYYIGVSSHFKPTSTDCKRYVSGGNVTDGALTQLFDIEGLTNIGENTFAFLDNLSFVHGHLYYIFVMGIDYAGECNMTIANTTIDVTQPERGFVTAGPYFDLASSYTSDDSSIYIHWKDYKDDISGIKSYNVSLWSGFSCVNDSIQTLIGDHYLLDADIRSFVFYNLDLQRRIPYFVKVVVTNGAGLWIEDSTEPVLLDTSIPSPGVVVEGSKFNEDVVWWGSTSEMKGTILHYQNSDGESCPSQTISFADDIWVKMEGSKMIDYKGNTWNIIYRPELVNIDEANNKLKIKLAVSSLYDKMISGGYYRPADMSSSSKYLIKLRAAPADNGNPHNVITEVLFIEEDLETAFATYYPQLNAGLQDEDCSCCFNSTQSVDCGCSDCVSYLSNIFDGGTVSVESIQSRKRGCGLQIYTGPESFGLLWCSFADVSIPVMNAKFNLPENVADTYYDYTIHFFEEHEDQSAELCIEALINDQKLAVLCGIPYLGSSTNFLIHAWNRDRYVPHQDEDLFTWSVTAEVKSIIFPPSLSELCRFGDPFRGGNIAIIRYEAAIGSTPGSSDVHPFTEVLSPCIPCTDTCSRYQCDSSCDEDKMYTYTFTLTSLKLASHSEEDNYTSLNDYFLTVKAVLGSGNVATASSNGFYVDVTPPVLDELLYIDVDQGEYTPVKYQGSNTTIKCLWTCSDEQSTIVEYKWAIGTRKGMQDIQLLTSTGKISWGINDDLEGVLTNNGTYFVSVICKNEAGLQITFNDSEGVIVLQNPPDPEVVGGHIVAAEKFDYDIYPQNSLKTSDPTSVGVEVEVSNDTSIERYEFCLGSSIKTPGDIVRCVWVVHNASAEIKVENGCLMYNGQKAYDLNELRQDSSASATGGTFRMEPGRVIFVSIRLCNAATKCAYKHVGTVTVIDDLHTQSRASNGEGSLYFKVRTDDSTRRRRSDEKVELDVITPDNLTVGETVLLMSLTDEDLSTDYSSSSSSEFVPYIVNPNTTLNFTSRILLGRVQQILMSFSIVTVGQFEMPGQLVLVHTQISNNPNPGDLIHGVIHWNPDNQQWQLTAETCAFETDTLIQNEENKTTTIKVCNTRQSGDTEELYYKEQTQFAVVLMNADVTNNAPYLNSPSNLSFYEDQGILQYHLNASDPENDEVRYLLVTSEKSEIVQNLVLSQNGSLQFEICTHCYGKIEIEIQLYDVPESNQIESNQTDVILTLNILSVNDPPRIFLVDNNKYSLLDEDVTEEVQIFKDNVIGGGVSFTAIVGAYDLDISDTLVVNYSATAQGDFTVERLVTSYQSVINCNISLCLGRTPEMNPSQMQWVFSRVRYRKTSDFTGKDSVKLAVQDNVGALSDIITIAVYNLDMPCENGATCAATSDLPCDNPARQINFDDNYICDCPPTWTGKYCTEDVDECQTVRCNFPKECRNTIGGHVCEFPITIIVVTIGSIVALGILVFVVWRCCRRPKGARDDVNQYPPDPPGFPWRCPSGLLNLFHARRVNARIGTQDYIHERPPQQVNEIAVAPAPQNVRSDRTRRNRLMERRPDYTGRINNPISRFTANNANPRVTPIDVAPAPLYVPSDRTRNSLLINPTHEIERNPDYTGRIINPMSRFSESKENPGASWVSWTENVDDKGWSDSEDTNPGGGKNSVNVALGYIDLERESSSISATDIEMNWFDGRRQELYET